MQKFIESIFFIKYDFIESIIIRIVFLLLFNFIIAFTFASYGVYKIFLDIIYYIVTLDIIYVCLLFFLNIKQIKINENKINYIVLFFIATFCILNSFFYSESTIEGGHDQGTYLESAVLLSKTGSFSIDSNDKPFVYTYPAWEYYLDGTTKNIFLPGNAIYLSIFYKLFGFTGVEFANSFLLFFSSSIIYFIIKKIFNWKTAFAWVLLFLLNFYTIYFSRSTYVENIQLLFTWFYVYLFIVGYKNKNFNFIISAFIPLMLLMTVRLEAFMYIPMYIILLLILLLKNHLTFNKNHLFIYIFIIIIGVSIPINLYIFNNNLFLSTLSLISSNKDVANGNINNVPYNQQIFIWINIIYMFTPLFFMYFLLGTLNFIKQKNEIKILTFLIFLLIIPQFVFFFRPGIAFYLPWFIRRFWAVFMPFSLLIISSFIFEKFYKSSINSGLKVITIIFSFFILTLPGLSIILIKQGAGVMNFEKSLSTHFDQNDLVIFWDRYGYENFGPPLFFFYNTNVVYDRLPSHDKKTYARIMKSYNNVYLATSIKKNDLLNHPYFQNNVSFVDNIVSPSYLSISSSCDTRIYILNPLLFKNYDQIKQLCSKNNPPVSVDTNLISINIYKLDNNFKNKFVNENYDPNFKIINEILK